MIFGTTMTGRDPKYRHRKSFLPMQHIKESQLLNRLDSHYILRFRMDGGGGMGRGVWRNGHQMRWYWRIAMGGRTPAYRPPDPPMEAPEWFEPERMAA
jgi:hypothetical protein